ncbi:MAG TPA: M20/M25/M40 family metallo-hydrolase, partial [Acidobacteriaceae bacterium]|nr:M20/M25/M40 family metallo-hydrolase [Acidobacteriaceae bacterium]
YVADNGEASATAPEGKGVPPIALKPEVIQPLQKLVNVYWPNTPVIADMADGASDSKYTNSAGIPTYNWSAIELDPADMRAHGQDERLPVDSFWKGVQFWPQFIKLLTGGGPQAQP